MFTWNYFSQAHVFYVKAPKQQLTRLVYAISLRSGAFSRLESCAWRVLKGRIVYLQTNSTNKLFSPRSVPVLMPEMPSADMRTAMNPVRGPEFNISSREVEGLVLEIKENLRLSATTMKAIPCSHLSRKSSRASPYRIPGKACCGDSSSCDTCVLKRSKRRLQPHEVQEDPYELLQKLLRDGSLVNEAVRRVQLGLTPKQRYFYESDEDRSPVLRL